MVIVLRAYDEEIPLTDVKVAAGSFEVLSELEEDGGRHQAAIELLRELQDLG